MEKDLEILKVSLDLEMLEIMEQALADYAGDKNSKEYLEVMKQIQEEKEEK